MSDAKLPFFVQSCNAYSYISLKNGRFVLVASNNPYICSMKVYKRPLLMCLALVIYVTGMAVYFVPSNHEMSSTEKCVTVIVAYVLVGLLWLAMQYREELRRKGTDKE